MSSRVLVPLDETARDDEALAVARGLARRDGAKLILMHVQQPVTDLSVVVHTNQYLERRVQQLRAEGIEARSCVDYGQPPQEIVASAADEQPDLIILAPHQRAGWDALRHPSVTLRLLSHAAVPLLIWPEQMAAPDVISSLAVPGARVLVPLDGSELAERAVPIATRVAFSFNRPLLLVRVVPPPTLAERGREAVRWERDAQASELRKARTYLSVMRQRIIRESGQEVHAMVLNGSPSHELLRLAGSQTGSVLVLSTHGRTGVPRLLLGSVAADLVRQSPIPLLVVPPRAWDEAAIAHATMAIDEPEVLG